MISCESALGLLFGGVIVGCFLIPPYLKDRAKQVEEQANHAECNSPLQGRTCGYAEVMRWQRDNLKNELFPSRTMRIHDR